MPRMLELIRANALSSHHMMSASNGALRLPHPEMVEILVYMAEHNKIFGANARFTLAAWDEASAKTIVADPATPKEVLNYWLDSRNLRSALFPLLLENQSVPLTKIAELATRLKGEWIDFMLDSPRIHKSRPLQNDLVSNKDLTGMQTARVQELITGKPAQVEAAVAAEVAQETPAHSEHPNMPGRAETIADLSSTTLGSAPASTADSDPEAETALVAFFVEHAA